MTSPAIDGKMGYEEVRRDGTRGASRADARKVGRGDPLPGLPRRSEEDRRGGRKARSDPAHPRRCGHQAAHPRLCRPGTKTRPAGAGRAGVHRPGLRELFQAQTRDREPVDGTGLWKKKSHPVERWLTTRNLLSSPGLVLCGRLLRPAFGSQPSPGLSWASGAGFPHHQRDRHAVGEASDRGLQRKGPQRHPGAPDGPPDRGTR